ncbi:formylglycine-generating enzyme family protein [Verrucomicrobia bacterium]|nr:formylglycine-generating enzyme family protein [Verrucomicrobiota bacterium]
MTRELIFTSVPVGLEPGRSGYCTVARSRDIPGKMVREIEKLSVLDLSQSTHSAPEVSSFRIIESGNSIHFLLSRTRSAGTDYTNRTNYISHHLIFSPEDVAGLPPPSAILDQWTGWKDGWDEQPRYLDSESGYDFSAIDPGDSKKLNTWRAWTEDSANAKILGKGHSILRTAPGDETFLLRLYSESCSLLASPSDAWNFPFTTYLQPMDNAEDFVWIGGWEGSPADKIDVGSSISFIGLDPFDEKLLYQGIEETIPQETERTSIEMAEEEIPVEELLKEEEPVELAPQDTVETNPEEVASISYSASQKDEESWKPSQEDPGYQSLEEEKPPAPQAVAPAETHAQTQPEPIRRESAPVRSSKKTKEKPRRRKPAKAKTSASQDTRKILIFCLPFAAVCLFLLSVVVFLLDRINDLERQVSENTGRIENLDSLKPDSSGIAQGIEPIDLASIPPDQMRSPFASSAKPATPKPVSPPAKPTPPPTVNKPTQQNRPPAPVAPTPKPAPAPPSSPLPVPPASPPVPSAGKDLPALAPQNLKDLHILFHVDGSGSMLQLRNYLKKARDTNLKEALLPFYDNDESIYDKRVLVVDGMMGERTLRFFAQAAEKKKVLAFVFQEEAQPDYNLPSENKNPTTAYSSDLRLLQSKLTGRDPDDLYRGIMFQVDRGKTYAGSFKEFVTNAWQGKGYLAGAGQSLAQYHFSRNAGHVRNGNGIVFADEYHLKSESTPERILQRVKSVLLKVGIPLDRNALLEKLQRNSLPLRTWTDLNGNSMRARLLQVSGDKVRILREDGEDFISPIALFSRADRTYIKAFEKEEAKIRAFVEWDPKRKPFAGLGDPLAPQPKPNKPAQAGFPLRTWTDLNGNSMRARLLQVSGDKVRILREDGEEFVSPIALFSAPDRAFIKAFQGQIAQAQPAQPVRPPPPAGRPDPKFKDYPKGLHDRAWTDKGGNKIQAYLWGYVPEADAICLVKNTPDGPNLLYPKISEMAFSAADENYLKAFRAWRESVLRPYREKLPEMVRIPAGKFLMGSPPFEEGRKREETQHEVTISNSFLMAKYKVSKGEWISVMGNLIEVKSNKGISKIPLPSHGAWSNHTRPGSSQTVNRSKKYMQGYVGNFFEETPVNAWYDHAREYCRKLTELHREKGLIGKDLIYRLPTEAEFEYALRAGTKTAYFWGNNREEGKPYGLDYRSSSDRLPNNVGTLGKPNPWGLYDLVDSKWGGQFISDKARNYEEGGAAFNPAGKKTDPVGETPKNLKISDGSNFRGLKTPFSDENFYVSSYVFGLVVKRGSSRSAARPVTDQGLGHFRIVLAKPIP